MKKNKIILVNLPPSRNYTYDKAGTVYPATSLLLIGTILKEKGFDVKLIDGALREDYQKNVIDLLADDVLFVGFSVMTSQLLPAYVLSQKIKNFRKDIPVVFGGIHPTLYPAQTVQNPCVDIVVINEGSKTVIEIVKCLETKEDFSEIKGIAYKDSSGNPQLTKSQEYDDINDLPHIDFDLIDVGHYLNVTSLLDRELNPENDEPLRLMPILTGLGCCYQCNFCVNVILKRKYRFRSAASIVEEIKRLQKKYNANAFLFFDEDFFISRSRLLELIDLVEKENLKFKARIWARVSYFSKDSYSEIIPKLERIGIRSIAMGAESGSQRMLDHIKKGIKVGDTIHAAKELSNTNITARFSLMVGLDSETKEDVKATYSLCGKLLKYNKLTDIAGPFIYRYYPGSPMFESIVKAYNIKIPDSVEEWGSRLNDDGSLIIDSQKHCWPNFNVFIEAMNNYVNICNNILRKGVFENNVFVGMIKSVLLWRLMHGGNFYVIDCYMFRVIKGTRNFVRQLFRRAT